MPNEKNYEKERKTIMAYSYKKPKGKGRGKGKKY